MPIHGNLLPFPRQSPLKIYIVEDESLVAMDLEERLTKLGYVVCGTADNGKEALDGIRSQKVDLVLMDIHLRDASMDGVDVAGELRKTSEVPVVFVTAHADETTLRRAGQTEPFGYVLKPFDERELRATIEMALYRHQSESRLQKVERWLATTLQSIGDGVIATNELGRITLINPLAETVTGWSRCDAIGRPLEEVFSIYGEPGGNETVALYSEAIRTGVTIHLGENKSLKTKDGRMVPVDDSIAPIRDDDGLITGCVVVFRDCTHRKQLQEERRRMEVKMQEAQRLESLGVLAAGIAHDFNNLLTVVSMNASLAKLVVQKESPVREHLGAILSAGERAAQLCMQMLDYAGQGQIDMEPLNINTLTSETTQLLATAISKKAHLSMDLAEDLPNMIGDRSQLQQVLMNLVINASDALGENSGKIVLRTRHQHVAQDELARCRAGGNLEPGEYLVIEVTDTGPGMPPEVQARIFDPFFTTKFTGRGLGLAAVIGIVRRHGGDLAVQSILGKGTTFRIYLPASETTEQKSQDAVPEQASWHGHGHALIVDDEAAIRSIGEVVLNHLGFEVDVAEDGEQGLHMILGKRDGYRIVLLDLTMPKQDGREVYRQIRKHFPMLPIVIMSGYSSQSVNQLTSDGSPTVFVQKPFSVEAIRQKLKALLG